MQLRPFSVPAPFKIMGILNCTPDSFSDGGRFVHVDSAIRHACQLVEDGADIIDIGAESTRPGAVEISAGLEWERLKPILIQLQKELPAHIAISVDTRKPDTMLKAADSGVQFINNVNGLAPGPVLRCLAGYRDLSYIAMHMHKCPQTMQIIPLEGLAAIEKVDTFFSDANRELQKNGFSQDRLWFDPGIGFGKSDQVNLCLMARTPEYSKHYKMVLGVSRKSWIGRCLGISDPESRDHPSKIAELSLALSGAKIIRTHEVKNLAQLRDVVYKTEV